MGMQDVDHSNRARRQERRNSQGTMAGCALAEWQDRTLRLADGNPGRVAAMPSNRPTEPTPLATTARSTYLRVDSVLLWAGGAGATTVRSSHVRGHRDSRRSDRRRPVPARPAA